jgi:CHAT domain-containing protein
MEPSLVAEAAGIYRAEVRSLEQGGAGGRYELRVEQLRAAKPPDVTESAASAAFSEANKLGFEWTESSLRKAIVKYREAERAWRSAGRLSNAVGAMVKAAEVHLALGEYRQALTLYRAAAQSRRAGERLSEFAAVGQVGRLYSYLGDNDKAQAHVEQAFAYYEQSERADQSPQMKRARAETLNVMAEVCYAKGDLIIAARYLERSLELWRQVGDRHGEARARLLTGYVLASTGEGEGALAKFREALTLYRTLAHRHGEALSLTAIGSIHSLRGEEQAALDLHLEAGHIFRQIGDRQSEAVTLNGVGQAYEDLDEKQTALDNYKQALKLLEANKSLDFVSVALCQIAKVYGSMGDDKQALTYYGRCIRLSRAAGKKRMEAYALNNIAAIYDAQGRRRETLGQYRKVLNLYRRAGDRRGQAIALNSIGDFHSSLGAEREALSFYKQALAAGVEAGDREVELSTLYNIARAARTCGDLVDALSHVERSVEIIEALRTYVASPDLRSSYFASVHKHYRLYIELLMQMERQHPGQDFAVKALRASESARARSLIEMLGEAGTDIRRGVEPSLLERERALQRQLRLKLQYQGELSRSKQTHAEAAEVAREVRQLTADYQALQSQVKEQSPRYAMLTQPNPLSLKEIQAELGEENTVLLEYALGDERSYLWAVTPDTMSSYELPARATLEAAAREVYNLLTARQLAGGKIDAGYKARVEAADRQYYEKASELSRMLLAPVAERLGNKRLLVVTEGVLQYVPFDSLPLPSAAPDDVNSRTGVEGDDRSLLVSRHEIVTLPSISTLAAIRRERSQAAGSTEHVVAVLADPVFTKDDSRVLSGRDLVASVPAATDDTDSTPRALRNPDGFANEDGIMRLTHTSQEADAIMAAAPRNAVLVARGFDANRETAMSSRLGQYKILHFATHGFINSEHPELSGIVLSMVNERGERKDGFLQLHDIYNLNLSADLVVLSACKTALGKDVSGEGLMGLTRGFMYAGAKSVVASLWEVDDSATAELMGYFYRAMLQEGLSPAAALRTAKESMRRKRPSLPPYYWAGFVLQGEYRESLKVGGKKTWPPVNVILALLIPISAVLYLLARRRGSFRGR